MTPTIWKQLRMERVISDLEFPIIEDHLGEEFRLVAIGFDSGLYAETTFTDGNISFQTIGLPIGLNITILVTRTEHNLRK